MRSETLRVLLSLGATAVLFVLSLPNLLFAFFAFAFSFVAAGGIVLLEFLRQSVPGVDPTHITINGLPPFVQVALAGLALVIAIGLSLSPPVTAFLIAVRSFRSACISALGSVALLVVLVAVLFPFLGADFILNGRNAGEIVFYLASTGILHAVVAGLLYYDLRRSGRIASQLGRSSVAA